MLTGDERAAKRLVQLVCLVVIGLSAYIFLARGLIPALHVLKPGRSATDLSYWYAAGEMWNQSENPYLVEEFVPRLEKVAAEYELREKTGFYYPPHTAALFGLVSHRSLANAHRLLVVANLALFAAGILMLGRVLAEIRSIGLLEITLLAGFFATGSLRVNLRLNQISLLAFFLMMSTYMLHRSGRDTLAGISLAGLTFKPTFFPLFAGYYLVRGCYRFVIVAAVTAAGFLLLPLAITGRPIVGTLAAWVNTLTKQGAPNHINSPSPDSEFSTLLSHLAPLVYRIFGTQSVVTTAIQGLILVFFAAAIVFLVRSTRWTRRSLLLDFSLVSTLTILSTYHRPYDDFLLFPGLVYLFTHAMERGNSPECLRWLLLTAGILISSMLPIDLAVRMTFILPGLSDWYLWRVMSQFHTWTALFLLGGLLVLKVRAWRAESRFELGQSQLAGLRSQAS